MGVVELPGTGAQNGADGRVQLGQGTVQHALEQVIQGRQAADGAIDERRSKGPVTGSQTAAFQLPDRAEVGIGALFQHILQYPDRSQPGCINGDGHRGSGQAGSGATGWQKRPGSRQCTSWQLRAGLFLHH